MKSIRLGALCVLLTFVLAFVLGACKPNDKKTDAESEKAVESVETEIESIAEVETNEGDETNEDIGSGAVETNEESSGNESAADETSVSESAGENAGE